MYVKFTKFMVFYRKLVARQQNSNASCKEDLKNSKNHDCLVDSWRLHLIPVTICLENAILKQLLKE